MPLNLPPFGERFSGPVGFYFFLDSYFGILVDAINAAYQFRGVWDAEYSYDVNDGATFGGQLWIALRSNLNSEPAEGADWTIGAAKGADGVSGSGSGDVRDFWLFS